MKPVNPYFENTDEDPEFTANKVLAEIGWNGSLPIDLIEICEMYGFDYIFEVDPSMKEEGTTRFRGDGDFYIFINTHNTDCENGFSNDQVQRRRQRFTLAHEIAHCTYKSHVNLQLQQNLSNRSNPHSRTYQRIREDQANRFAAHLLVPRKAFQKFAREVGWNNILKLICQTSEQFDVSLEVAAQQCARLADFPCITILFNSNGSPKRVPVFSSDFQETKLFYSKNEAAPRGTVAEKLLSSGNQKQHDKKRFRDASTWFPNEPDWKTEKFSVIETSISVGRYGVLTFLEIEELENW